MKKIVVASDSHFNTYLLKNLCLRHCDADVFLNAGDSEDNDINIYPFISVKGNNDNYIKEEVKIIKIDDIKIYLTHGHKIEKSEENLLRIAKKNECNILIYGHTHVPFYKCIDNIHKLNPGALAYPRSAIGQTYAIITITDDKKILVEHRQF